jgi:hypothetical protein
MVPTPPLAPPPRNARNGHASRAPGQMTEVELAALDDGVTFRVGAPPGASAGGRQARGGRAGGAPVGYRTAVAAEQYDTGDPQAGHGAVGGRMTPTGWVTSRAERADPPRNAAQRIPAPRLRQIAGVSGWAALLGVLGLLVAVRALLGIIGGAPTWYEPTMIVIGLSGIAAATIGFLTVHIRVIPWLAMTASSVALLASIVVTGFAF